MPPAKKVPRYKQDTLDILFALEQAYNFQNKLLQIELNQHGEFIFHNLSEVVDNRECITSGLDILICDSQPSNLWLRYSLINGLFYTSNPVDYTMQQYAGFDSFAVYAQSVPFIHTTAKQMVIFVEKANILRWVGRNPNVCV